MTAQFQHEEEKERLKALTGSVGFRKLLDLFHQVYGDLTSFARLPGRNFPVTAGTEPDLYELYQTAAERLQMKPDVPVYLSFDHSLGAETVGTDGNCAIVLTSECVDRFSSEQLLAVFGHELAHIRYGHVCFLNIERLSDDLLARIPLAGGLAAESLKTLLLKWKLAAEYTADRGAAIAAGRMEPALKNLLCGMGGSGEEGEIFLETGPRILPQLPELQDFSLAGQALLQILAKEFELPFGNLRAARLREWCGSKQCREQFSPVYYRSFSGQERVKREPGLQEEKLRLLHEAAEGGHPKAQSRLGSAYLRGGQGLAESLSWGLHYLRQAALQKDPGGLYGLGVCFWGGAGKELPEDKKRAAWLFELAAEQGMKAPAEMEKGAGPDTGVPSGAESLVRQVLAWYQSRDSGKEKGEVCFCPSFSGKEEEPAGSLLSRLREYLWIPEKDPVYAFEAQQKNLAQEQTTALTRYGIYWYAGRGLPERVSWREFLAGELTGETGGEGIELKLNGRPIGEYKSGEKECSVWGILVKIRALWEKQGG